MANGITEVKISITQVMKNAEQLDELVHETIREYGKKKKKPKEVAIISLNIAVESYLASFPKSEINMDQRVSLGKTTLVALGTGIGGGIFAYILHPWSQIIPYQNLF